MVMDQPNHEIVEDKAIRSELQKKVDDYLRRGGRIKVTKRITRISDLSESDLETLKNKLEWNRAIKQIEIK
jgi:predicted transcriptional regulator of viral defense system